MIKTILSILGAIFFVWLAWYFGFFKFLGIKGAKCGSDKGNYKYGKCDIRLDSDSKYCDCSKPGYATDGVADLNCEPGRMIYDNDCG